MLAVLKKHDIPATFFVVGANVTRYPDLVAAIHEQGSELGVHSFSHPDLGTKPRWRVDRELAETQLAISGAAGVTTFLLRPPYSSSADAIDNLRLEHRAGRGRGRLRQRLHHRRQRGLAAAGHRRDHPQRDAQAGRPDGLGRAHARRGRRPVRDGGRAGQVDPADEGKGFKFATVAGGVEGHGRARSPPRRTTASPAACSWPRSPSPPTSWRGSSYLLIIVGVLVGVRLVLMVVYARRHAKRRRRPDFSWGPPVDRAGHRDRARLQRDQEHRGDGPVHRGQRPPARSAGRRRRLHRRHRRRRWSRSGIPNVRVLRQKNSGKPKALNAGIRAAKHDIIIMIDGDTVFEPDTVRLLAQPFADPTVGAVAGNVKVAQPRRAHRPACSTSSTWSASTSTAACRTSRGSIPPCPARAARSAARRCCRSAACPTDTLAEDTDLTIALGRAGWRVVFEERARAWTEAPATMAQLWKQRYRWSYGTMQAMWKHRRAVPREGARGQGRAARARARGRVPHPPAAHRAAGRRLLPLRPGLRRPGAHAAARRRDARRAAAHGVLRVPAGAASRSTCCGCSPLQQIVYRQLMYSVLIRSVASAVSGVARALAADEPHRRAEQPAAEAVGRARPGGGQRPHRGARAAQQERARAAQGKPVDLRHRTRRRGDRPRALARPVEGRGAVPGDRLGRGRARVPGAVPGVGRAVRHRRLDDVALGAARARGRRDGAPAASRAGAAVGVRDRGRAAHAVAGLGRRRRRQPVLRRQPRLLDLPVPRPARQHRGLGPDRRPLVHPGLPVVRAAHPVDARGDAAQCDRGDAGAARRRRARRLAELGSCGVQRHRARADGLLHLRDVLDVRHGAPRRQPEAGRQGAGGRARRRGARGRRVVDQAVRPEPGDRRGAARRGADLGGRGHPAAERVARAWRGWTRSPCCAACWG